MRRLLKDQKPCATSPRSTASPTPRRITFHKPPILQKMERYRAPKTSIPPPNLHETLRCKTILPLHLCRVASMKARCVSSVESAMEGCPFFYPSVPEGRREKS